MEKKETETPHVPQKLSDVEMPPESERTSTGIPALDTCLAEDDDTPGGLPIGASVLLSGAPGGGKSTLALLAADASGNALILHGEEPVTSVKRRWARLGLKSDPWTCPLAAAEDACQVIRDTQPTVVVIDSIQTMSMDGHRGRRFQTEALEMVIGQAISSGATVWAVCHVNKSGDAHLGDNSMAHLVDVHMHLTTNAKKGSRTLELRKNRHGRAGFEVPLAIGAVGITVGTPTAAASLVSARSAMEKAAEIAAKWLQEGKTLTAGDFDESGCSASAFRAGLELAARRLIRDGVEVEKVKVGLRGGWRVKPAEPANGKSKVSLLEVT